MALLLCLLLEINGENDMLTKIVVMGLTSELVLRQLLHHLLKKIKRHIKDRSLISVRVATTYGIYLQ